MNIDEIPKALQSLLIPKITPIGRMILEQTLKAPVPEEVNIVDWLSDKATPVKWVGLEVGLASSNRSFPTTVQHEPRSFIFTTASGLELDLAEEWSDTYVRDALDIPVDVDVRFAISIAGDVLDYQETVDAHEIAELLYDSEYPPDRDHIHDEVLDYMARETRDYIEYNLYECLESHPVIYELPESFTRTVEVEMDSGTTIHWPDTLSLPDALYEDVEEAYRAMEE